MKPPVNLISFIQAVLQPFGLTYPQYLVLLALWEKDGVTVKELGKRLNLGTGTLTPMITRMAEHDWLRKERSKIDERKVHINLQPKALEKTAGNYAKSYRRNPILSYRVARIRTTHAKFKSIASEINQSKRNKRITNTRCTLFSGGT